MTTEDVILGVGATAALVGIIVVTLDPPTDPYDYLYNPANPNYVDAPSIYEWERDSEETSKTLRESIAKDEYQRQQQLVTRIPSGSLRREVYVSSGCGTGYIAPIYTDLTIEGERIGHALVTLQVRNNTDYACDVYPKITVYNNREDCMLFSADFRRDGQGVKLGFPTYIPPRSSLELSGNTGSDIGAEFSIPKTSDFASLPRITMMIYATRGNTGSCSG